MRHAATGFVDRRAAGRTLAAHLPSYVGRDDVLVLGLPRGGVPVAYEVARVLRTPLDVMPVRKIGMPGNREFAIGAVAGQTVLRESKLPAYVSRRVFVELARKERVELGRREGVYRAGLPPLKLDGM